MQRLKTGPAFRPFGLLLSLFICSIFLCISPLVRAQTTSSAVLKTVFDNLQRENLFPADLEILHVEIDELGTQVFVKGAFREFLLRDGDVLDQQKLELHRELRLEALAGAWLGNDFFGGLEIFVLDDNTFVSLADLVAPFPDAVFDVPAQKPRTRSKRTTNALPFGGALVDKRIALSAGHGWINNGNGYGTQREHFAFDGCGNCGGVVEDFYTAEVMSRYLIPLLRKMGAELVVVREPDHDTRAAIIRDESGAQYSETGTWAQGSSAGGWNDTYRTNSPDDLGSASYALDAASVGRNLPRLLSVRYRHGGNRTPAAIAAISHVGGDTLFNIDQRDMGEHWIPLGNYVLDDESVFEWLHGPGDGFLISDAVKVGGGWHDAANKPWWQMSAKEYVAYAVAPTSVTDYGEVSIRPAYAEYVGADAYISIHANAIGNSTSNGISTYRYSCQLYSDFSSSTGATNCDDPPGSTALLDEVQAAMLGNIHADFDPNFDNRNGRVANFGELRTLDDTPGILIESGFFTNTDAATDGRRMSDNQALQDPRWREALVRGIAEGLARFLAPGSGLPPRRVDGLFAKNDGNGGLQLSWNAVAGAAGYHVFVSQEGRAFAEPVLVESGTSISMPNLPAGSLRFFKVAALNDNGEGWDSGVVAARTPPNANSHHVLVVDAYDRRDAWVQKIDNDFTISIEHGTAIFDATDEVFFDGCLDEVLDSAVSRGLVVDDYALIDFAAGKDATEDQPVSKTHQSLLRAFVAAGGKLILSGEEVALTLMQTSNDPDDEAFLREVLHAEYVADNANATGISGASHVAFANLGDFQLSDGEDEGAYEVRAPDVIAALAPAESVLVYAGGSTAAVLDDDVFFFAAPLEGVASADGRRRIMAAAFAALLVVTPVIAPPEDAGTQDPIEADAGEFVDDAGVFVPFVDGGFAADAGTDPTPEPGPDPTPEPGVPLEPDVLQPYYIEPEEPKCGCHATSRQFPSGLPQELLLFGILFGAFCRKRPQSHLER